MYWLVNSFLLVVFLVYVLHLYLSRHYDYWLKRNVPFIKPKPFVGNLMDVLLQKYNMSGFFEKIYNDINSPFFGIFCFSKPALVVRDVNLVKQILVKDFDHFVDRVMYASEHDPATAHMLFIEKGEEWRIMRSKMSPFFSPSKVKTMFSVINCLAISLSNNIAKNHGMPNLNAKSLSLKYSVDVIAKCVFNIQSKSLETEDGEFITVANKIFDTRPITSFRYLCYFFFHSFARIFRMKLFDPDVVSFLRKVFWECIQVREEENLRGNDLIDMIVDLRKNKEFCQRMEFGNSILFFFGSFVF